jgi:hypothetical protein
MKVWFDEDRQPAGVYWNKSKKNFGLHYIPAYQNFDSSLDNLRKDYTKFSVAINTIFVETRCPKIVLILWGFDHLLDKAKN